MDAIPRLISQTPWIKIVVITAFASIDTAVEAIRRGALDYLPKPFTPEQVVLVARRIAHFRRLEMRVASMQDAADAAGTVNLGTSSPAMQRVLDLGRQVAASDATVLLRGESGTGKGVIARAIHGWSRRSRHAFAVVACPSLSAELLESELFGHVKGAFTGAIKDTPGRIAASEGGTLFLDEIGDLPIALQPKLLRFLQDRVYERVGDSVTRTANVRIITATNIDLDAAVKSGRFREDLFYRLNVIQLDLPPLRERQEDIPQLARQMLAEFGRGKRLLSFSDHAEQALLSYAWPGNVRELRNVIERATILCPVAQIGLEHLPPALTRGHDTEARLGDLVSIEAIEELHIRRVLAQMPALDEAARILGIDQATLWRRRKRYGI